MRLILAHQRVLLLALIGLLVLSALSSPAPLRQVNSAA
jgi:hypothetical protein